MTSLSELMSPYPHLRLATPADNARILEILDATSMKTSELQVSFERGPDYFSFFPSQGDAFVFLFLNKDGAAHGLAVLSLRDFQIGGQRRRLAYGSDLRIMGSLSRHARIEWGKLYGLLVGSLPEVAEFGGGSGTYTAVWDDNGAAQRALIESKKDRGFVYRPVTEYSSFSVWGRRLFPRAASRRVRAAVPRDREALQEVLCAPAGEKLKWDPAELERTLRTFGKTWDDFLVIEDAGRVRALTLPVREDARRTLLVKAMPRALRWIGRALPLFGRPALGVGQPMKSLSLLFFRGDAEDAAAFTEFAWKSARPLPRDARFHVILISGPRSLRLEPALRKHGFLSSRIDGKLFEVNSSSDHRAEPVPNLDEVEIALL